MLESLEERRMLALMFSLENDVLTIRGTPAADTIMADQAEGVITIRVNRATLTLPVEDVKSLMILAGDGNDSVTIRDSVGVGAEIRGGGGNDRLYGGSRASRIYGEAGNDRLGGGSSRDFFSGGGGTDMIDYSGRAENLEITLDGQPNDGARSGKSGEKDNVSVDIENIIGGSGHDLLIGSNARNNIRGGPGNDTILGLGGDDILTGNAGDDHIEGGDGDDFILLIDLSANDIAIGGEGHDTAVFDKVGEQQDSILDIEDEDYLESFGGMGV